MELVNAGAYRILTQTLKEFGAFFRNQQRTQLIPKLQVVHAISGIPCSSDSATPIQIRKPPGNQPAEKAK